MELQISYSVSTVWGQLENAVMWFESARGSYSTYDCMEKLSNVERETRKALIEIGKA